MTTKTFSKEALQLDYAKEADRISEVIREHVMRNFRKKGLVIRPAG